MKPFARRSLAALSLACFAALTSCERELDEHAFQKRLEQAYVEANPGFSVARRDALKSKLVRGDQVVELDLVPLYQEYTREGRTGAALDKLVARYEEEAKARRRTLEQAKNEVIPILKSGSWVSMQDLGAIGPSRVQEQIRPWRRELAKDVFVLLGVPEQHLGFRTVSIAEVKGSADAEDVWVSRAVQNLIAKVGTSTGVDVRGDDQRLLIYEIDEVEGIAGAILDAGFRKKMLEKFAKEELGAAVPTRDVLMIFDAAEFVATKPVRAKTHLIYDTQNHPGFRGLLKFDAAGISVLEPGKPEKEQKAQ